MTAPRRRTVPSLRGSRRGGVLRGLPGCVAWVGSEGLRGNGERSDEFEAVANEYRLPAPQAGPDVRYCLGNPTLIS
jgi:hypothetical protein